MADQYSKHDRERAFSEGEKGERSDFARDRGRLLHSSALRRLAAKTQVLSPTAGLDFARNRLTHSLEVAQVGREIGQALGLDPDLVDTACLAHDLGHPPFGHNGEKGLNEWALPWGGFEGNAQTLRLLTRIEPKVFASNGRSYGLNLTRASLDASCKYPWTSDAGVLEAGGGRNKFGVYDSDVEIFEWVRVGAPDRRLCIEAQVMDLSDDIGYSVHDFEDAIVNGYIDVPALSSRVNHDDLVDAMVEWIGGELSHDELISAFDRLSGLSNWIETWDGSRADMARLKNLTSTLIGRFAASATNATRENATQPSLARFGADVIVPRETRAEIAVLKGIVAAHVMSSESRRPIYAHQREVLTDLCNALVRLGPGVMERGFADDFTSAQTDTEQMRAVIDQVASLTDQSALAWHERLCN
ncbi:MAG: deoxyguanosinetriphosphate triphosphohydrolase [Microbacteriaceae bacterium]